MCGLGTAGWPYTQPASASSVLRCIILIAAQRIAVKRGELHPAPAHVLRTVNIGKPCRARRRWCGGALATAAPKRSTSVSAVKTRLMSSGWVRHSHWPVAGIGTTNRSPRRPQRRVNRSGAIQYSAALTAAGRRRRGRVSKAFHASASPIVVTMRTTLNNIAPTDCPLLHSAGCWPRPRRGPPLSTGSPQQRWSSSLSSASGDRRWTTLPAAPGCPR